MSEPEIVPTCIECGVDLAPNERREPFVCFDCATLPCACGKRHGRGYVCPERNGGGTVDPTLRYIGEGAPLSALRALIAENFERHCYGKA